MTLKRRYKYDFRILRNVVYDGTDFKSRWDYGPIISSLEFVYCCIKVTLNGLETVFIPHKKYTRRQFIINAQCIIMLSYCDGWSLLSKVYIWDSWHCGAVTCISEILYTIARWSVYQLTRNNCIRQYLSTILSILRYVRWCLINICRIEVCKYDQYISDVIGTTISDATS